VQSIIGILEKHARVIPDKIAIIFHDTRITYGELNGTVNRLANSLIGLGLKKGDRVGLMTPRVPELVISFLAVVKAQGIACPVNFKSHVEKARDVINAICPAFLIVDGSIADYAWKAVIDSTTAIIVTGSKAGRGISWNDLSYSGRPDNPSRQEREDDVIYLNFTSGTTGDPKGAVTTFSNLYWNTSASIEALKMDHRDIHLCMFAPFAHPHEIFARPLYLGGTMVLVEKIYPKTLVENISKHGVTCMMGLAPMYEKLLDQLAHKRYDLGSLRIAESGGMYTRAELVERFRNRVGVPIIPVWGSTETTGIAVANRPGEEIKTGSIGRPCPYYEVKIINEKGDELAAGEVGEMAFKGPAVVSGYFAGEANERNTFQDGWYMSGDLGRKDNDGNIYFIERKTGMMKVTGLKVYPLEIELALLEHPHIREVAVISVTDRLRGEVPRAVIVTDNGEKLTKEEVISFCKTRLSHYKLPRSVEIRKSLPKIGSGKVNKKALQMEYK
jgi:acyl-CoA synthetase (AMP-forming)/AMP-acid ligase II